MRAQRTFTLALGLMLVAGRAPAAGRAESAPPEPLPAAKAIPALDEPVLAASRTPSWLRLSGEFRLRFEGRDLGYGGDRDGYGLFRTRLNVRIKPSRYFEIFFQGQDSRAPAIRDSRANGVFRDPFDIRQAHVKISSGESGPVSVTAGRQLLIYGDQRLVGALDWTNTSRAFDAIKLELKGGPAKVDVFSASVVANNPSRRLNQSPEGNNLHGIYGSVKSRVLTVEPFVLLRTNPLVLGEGGAGDMDRYSYGARLWAKKLSGWDYSATFVKQTGQFGFSDISARALSINLGKTWDTGGTPRTYVEYNYASGDDDPNDGQIGWFDDIYPTAHLYYGYNDLVGWRNIKNLRLGVSFVPVGKTKTSVNFHSFCLANPNDNLYTRISILALVRSRDTPPLLRIPRLFALNPAHHLRR